MRPKPVTCEDIVSYSDADKRFLKEMRVALEPKNKGRIKGWLIAFAVSAACWFLLIYELLNAMGVW